MEVTVDEFIEVLYQWLQMHSGKDSLKRTAKSIGYKLSWFKPERSISLLEELLVLQTAVIIYRASRQLGDVGGGDAVVKGFFDKVIQTFGLMLSEGDKEFYQRFADKFKRYSIKLSEQKPFPELASYFLKNLSNNMASYNPKSLLSMAANIKVFNQSTHEALSGYSVNV